MDPAGRFEQLLCSLQYGRTGICRVARCAVWVGRLKPTSTVLAHDVFSQVRHPDLETAPTDGAFLFEVRGPRHILTSYHDESVPEESSDDTQSRMLLASKFLKKVGQLVPASDANLHDRHKTFNSSML